jgi:hypothetical protein
MGGGPDREAEAKSAQAKAAQAKRREERLAAALRENLKRRKAQQRGRAATIARQGVKPERAPDGSH